MNHLRIYDDALRLVVLCKPHWEKLSACGQREEASQLRRSAPALARNIAEGTGRYDGNGKQRFESASGEARETIATLQIAVAVGLIEAAEVAGAIDCADKIIATLFKMLRKRSA